MKEFREKIDNDEFVEWEEVYKDHFYGTLKTEVQRIWDNSQHVIFDVDVVGGSNLKKHYGERALAIFIRPPSLESLRDRLEHRSTDSQEKIRTRLSKAESELKYEDQFDKVIINDVLERALEEAYQLVKTFLTEDE